MATVDGASNGLFSLPNEILLDMLDLFPTPTLMNFATVCRKFHTLVLRIVHNRLQLAASLGVQALYLRCHHPSAELRAPKFPCSLLGTDGLPELLPAIHDDQKYLGQVKSMFELYSRYRPSKEQPPVTVSYRPMTGARVYTAVDPTGLDPQAPVRETVTVDAHESFTQLTTSVWLGRREAERGFLVGMHPVSAGWIRVWRDWLVKQCESRRWTDGEPVVVHESSNATEGATTYLDPRQDPCILWLGGNHVGIKIRVREKNSPPSADPFASDVDVPVNYLVEFEELYVRTSHLHIVLGEIQKNEDSGSGKAIVFGSFRG